MSGQMKSISIRDGRRLAYDACLGAGASPAMANALADATLSAACSGRPGMGFPHFLDYLHSIRDGRIAGKAHPRFDHVLPAVIHADADGGIAQLGFDQIYDDFTNRVRTFGVAVFTQKNSYTAGELGYYVRRLAQDGLLSIAGSNGPALMAAAEGGSRVYCTNPLAFGAPLPSPLPPLVIDQATSATAFVNIARAAGENRTIPHGWAVDETGALTTDPARAVLGALLPFGGYKGANIALLVEVLSAGLSGAAWSLDSPDFRTGNQTPAAGMTIVAISPVAADPDFAERVAAQFERLRAMGVHIPGGQTPSDVDETVMLPIDGDLLAEISGFADLAGAVPDR